MENDTENPGVTFFTVTISWVWSQLQSCPLTWPPLSHSLLGSVHLSLSNTYLYISSSPLPGKFNSVSVFQALVGEKACYQSVSSYAGQIVYLGTKVLCCIIFSIWCLCVHNSWELLFVFVELSLAAHWPTLIVDNCFEKKEMLSTVSVAKSGKTY